MNEQKRGEKVGGNDREFLLAIGMLAGYNEHKTGYSGLCCARREGERCKKIWCYDVWRDEKGGCVCAS